MCVHIDAWREHGARERGMGERERENLVEGSREGREGKRSNSYACVKESDREREREKEGREREARAMLA